jgi:uncharacterized membrane protein YdbT with pleckstrin-like domain
MSYVDKILEPGETVVLRASVSWTIYAPAILFAVCAVLVYALGSRLPGHEFQVDFVAAVLALAAIAVFLPRWFRRWTTEIAVTDRRVIMKRGFIKRHTVEMNMQKVESVDVDQSLIGRIFDYGDVTVRGTGSSLETLRNIDAPLKLRSTVTAG